MASLVYELNTNIEHWSNYNDMGKQKYSKKSQANSILHYILKINSYIYSARQDIPCLFHSSRFYIIRKTADIPPIQFALCTNLCSNKAQTFRAHLSHSLCFRYLPV